MMSWFTDCPSFHGPGWIFMLVFWALLILLVVSLVKKSGGGRGEDNAEEILRKRYARGEISPEDFLRMKKELRE